jgi:DNA repair protein RecO (recombination protein O)
LSYKTSGINLKSHNLGNSDKIITIFSRDLGKIKAAARGSRKPASKFGGRLELFAHNDYLLNKGKTLDIINQAETIEPFMAIRSRFETIQAGLYLLWAVDKATVEYQPNPALFDLLLSCLKALTRPGLTAKGLAKIKNFFQREVLNCEGIGPEEELSETAFEQKFFDYVG